MGGQVSGVMFQRWLGLFCTDAFSYIHHTARRMELRQVQQVGIDLVTKGKSLMASFLHKCLALGWGAVEGKLAGKHPAGSR